MGVGWETSMQKIMRRDEALGVSSECLEIPMIPMISMLRESSWRESERKIEESKIMLRSFKA
jgi:hypothetical protein